MPRPVAPHAFSMTWTDGLFIHWPFDPEQLRPHVPAPLELDTYDGRAWVSLLPFVLSRAGVRFSPSFTRLTFPELNFRTYVRFDGAPGLYFFSVDVAHPVVPAVVGRGTRLPCYHADMDVRTRGDRVDFRSVRRRTSEPSDGRRGVTARVDATYGPDGGIFRAEPGTLDYWLAERRRMYDPVGERVLYADIAHDPWPLRPADVTVRENTMFEAGGLPTPEGEPRVRYSDELSITGSVPRWIRGWDGDTWIRPRHLAHR
ncbi:YqjF family protein [Halomarina halobia]|uniref:YqjF family protein n=2 Tax=Halomarina halobia TaxID=3033386 RepID=A0ABD6A7I2_9EURY